MPEVRVERAAKKDLKRVGPGPERTRIVAGLRRRLAEDAPNLDIKTITGAAPGWFRLRIGEYRICYYRIRVSGPTGTTTIYAGERAAMRLGQHRVRSYPSQLRIPLALHNSKRAY